MTTADIRNRSSAGSHTSAGRPVHTGFGSGWVTFAAVMLMIGGTLAILEGVTAIAKDDVLVVTPAYAYKADLTTWGWLHLALGIALVLAGAALFRGALWARMVAVVVAGFSMIANFMWLPHYPLWSLTIIAIDALVIWAVCTSGSRHRDTL